jgi:DNA repair exonuclease SbcCD ATPase subunit
MKLLHLQLQAFGRFSNTCIVLHDGLNLICGENETGKSTLHRFIRGMLFGFKREGTVRRYFTSEQEQYRPWAGKDYRGSLEYADHQGRRVLVERSFDPDETKILDALTGKSLTGKYTMDSRKEYLFAQEQLGLNATVFDNTIFLAQLGGKTEKELAREVGDRMARLSTSGREDLSAQQAMGDLKKKRDEIGTARATTRPFGQAVQLCEDLEREEKATAMQYESLRKKMEEKAMLTGQQQKRSERKHVLHEKLEQIRRRQLYEDGQKVMQLWQEREAEESSRVKVQEYAEFPAHVREDLRDSIARLESLADTALEMQQRLTVTGTEVQRLTGEMASFPKDVPYNNEAQRRLTLQFSRLMTGQERLKEEAAVLERLKEKRCTLQAMQQSRSYLTVLAEQIGDLEADDETIRSLQASRLPEETRRLKQESSLQRLRLKWITGLTGVAAVLSFAGAYYSYLNLLPEAALGLTGAALMAVLLGTYSYWLGGRKLRKQTQRQKDMDLRYQEEKQSLAELLGRRETMLTAAGAENLREARQMAEEYAMDEARLQQIQAECTETAADLLSRHKQLADEEASLKTMMAQVLPDPPSRELSEAFLEACLGRMEEQQARGETLLRTIRVQEELTGKMELLQRQENQLMAQRDRILQSSGATTWEEFLIGCARLAQYQAASEKIQRLDLQLEPYLKKYSISQWQAELTHLAKDSGNDLDVGSGEEEHRQELAETDRLLQETELHLAALQAEMEQALTGYRELVEIQEDLAAARGKKQVLEEDAAALDAAIAALTVATDRRHRLLAPQLNQRVGDIITRLTQGRYRKVRIDEDLTVTVSTPDEGRQVELAALSAGTVDQFYFAVRVAMADLISQDRKLPLFLDDPFMQYSSRRLRQVMNYVGELAQERQILLFTCRQQEQEMLDELAVPYQKIDLDAL